MEGRDRLSRGGWRVAASAAAMVAVAVVVSSCGTPGPDQPVMDSQSVLDETPPSVESQSDCIPRPGDPVSMVRSWSFGAAFVIATVGAANGTTAVYDPGYEADLHEVTIEEVLFDPTGDGVSEVDEIANVHYPPQECLLEPVANLEPGSRLLLVLAPPDPSKDVWTVDGAGSVLSVTTGPAGDEVTWQGTSTGCSGHVRFSLSAIGDALAGGTEPPPTGSCVPE
jgi:hypothetical protein